MISMNKYNRLMEHVNPSPDMEQRLHAALDQSPVRKLPVVCWQSSFLSQL